MKSVRLRLLVLALLPLVVLLPVLLVVTMLRWSEHFDGLLISKVASDLRIAEQYMQRIVTRQGNQITGVADSTGFRDAADAGDQQLDAFLAQSRDALGLDYLIVHLSGQAQILPPENTVVARAMAQGTATSIELFSYENLKSIAPELARRASIPLIQTEATIPAKREIENRGMVVLGATHIMIAGHSGVLIGGTF